MKKKAINSIEVPAVQESVGKVILFFRERLDEEKISEKIVSETMLVIEALFHNLL